MSVQADFSRFHRDNPQVYSLFDRFTRELIALGHKRFSADAVLHRIRWETAVKTDSKPFKIANAHAAYYARLWMQRNHRHEGFFTIRALRHLGELEAA